ncbi:MAG: peptidase M14, partial [Acidobacteria bacterium]
AARRFPAPSVLPQDLAGIWDKEHVSPPLPPLVDHAEVVSRINGVVSASPDLFAVEKIGESLEGRSIHHVKFGTGPYHVLLWSQMHGDEPTATSALFDLFEYIRLHRQEPAVSRILARLTLHVVPMLNPDGAERFERRNPQSIDVNRDALRLQTPEGQVLKTLRDRLKPGVGFNLHNQNWRTSVGDPPMPASISLLSVAFDEKRTVSPGRKLTKKLCAVIRDAVEAFAPGQIGRYDDEFEVRAFGDNLTLWGTPVVLIETGAWAAEAPDPPLVRLNFVALLTALDALATGRVDRADPDRYESLPVNESRLFYAAIRNATVINGSGIPPFTADIGIVANRRVRRVNGVRELVMTATIDDLGDLRTFGALRDIDGSGLTAVPDTGYQEGAVVELPDWHTRTDTTIAVGQSPRIALLRATEGGKYRVHLVLK